MERDEKGRIILEPSEYLISIGNPRAEYFKVYYKGQEILNCNGIILDSIREEYEIDLKDGKDSE